ACRAPGAAIALQVRWPSGYRERLAAEVGDDLVLAEPAWLEVGEGQIVVDLTAGSPAAPPSAATAVAVSGHDVVISALARDPDSDGRWTASYAAPSADVEEGRI